MISLRKCGFDRESFNQTLCDREVQKVAVHTADITIYSLLPSNMPDSKIWKVRRMDSEAVERFNENQPLVTNSVMQDSMPLWAKLSLINTGFFISVGDDGEQYFVEKNSVSTLYKFLDLKKKRQGYEKNSQIRNLMLKSEMDEQNIEISMIYRTEDRYNSCGDQIKYRSVVAFRSTKFDTTEQLMNLKTAVSFLEQKGGSVDKWEQDAEKIKVRVLFPELAENWQKEHGLSKALTPCITLQESETGDAAFRMQAAVVLLSGTQENRQSAEACRLAELEKGEPRVRINLTAESLSDLWADACLHFENFASSMEEMQHMRISPAGNADDNKRWPGQNNKVLKEFLYSAFQIVDFKSALGTKRRDQALKALYAALNPNKPYSAADLAMLILKVPTWTRKQDCNESVRTKAAENAAKIVKEAA